MGDGRTGSRDNRGQQTAVDMQLLGVSVPGHRGREGKDLLSLSLRYEEVEGGVQG